MSYVALKPALTENGRVQNKTQQLLTTQCLMFMQTLVKISFSPLMSIFKMCSFVKKYAECVSVALGILVSFKKKLYFLMCIGLFKIITEHNTYIMGM